MKATVYGFRIERASDGGTIASGELTDSAAIASAGGEAVAATVRDRYADDGATVYYYENGSVIASGRFAAFDLSEAIDARRRFAEYVGRDSSPNEATPPRPELVVFSIGDGDEFIESGEVREADGPPLARPGELIATTVSSFSYSDRFDADAARLVYRVEYAEPSYVATGVYVVGYGNDGDAVIAIGDGEGPFANVGAAESAANALRAFAATIERNPKGADRARPGEATAAAAIGVYDAVNGIDGDDAERIAAAYRGDDPAPNGGGEAFGDDPGLDRASGDPAGVAAARAKRGERAPTGDEVRRGEYDYRYLTPGETSFASATPSGGSGDGRGLYRVYRSGDDSTGGDVSSPVNAEYDAYAEATKAGDAEAASAAVDRAAEAIVRDRVAYYENAPAPTDATEAIELAAFAYGEGPIERAAAARLARATAAVLGEARAGVADTLGSLGEANDDPYGDDGGLSSPVAYLENADEALAVAYDVAAKRERAERDADRAIEAERVSIDAARAIAAAASERLRAEAYDAFTIGDAIDRPDVASPVNEGEPSEAVVASLGYLRPDDAALASTDVGADRARAAGYDPDALDTVVYRVGDEYGYAFVPKPGDESPAPRFDRSVYSYENGLALGRADRAASRDGRVPTRGYDDGEPTTAYVFGVDDEAARVRREARELRATTASGSGDSTDVARRLRGELLGYARGLREPVVSSIGDDGPAIGEPTTPVGVVVAAVNAGASADDLAANVGPVYSLGDLRLAAERFNPGSGARATVYRAVAYVAEGIEPGGGDDPVYRVGDIVVVSGLRRASRSSDALAVVVGVGVDTPGVGPSGEAVVYVGYESSEGELTTTEVASDAPGLRLALDPFGRRLPSIGTGPFGDDLDAGPSIGEAAVAFVADDGLLGLDRNDPLVRAIGEAAYREAAGVSELVNDLAEAGDAEQADVLARFGALRRTIAATLGLVGYAGGEYADDVAAIRRTPSERKARS